MKTPSRLIVGALFVVGALVTSTSRADASAIAIGNLSAVLTITPASGTLQYIEIFEQSADAQTQNFVDNSGGDDFMDTWDTPEVPATATSTATGASATASSSADALSASSSAIYPGTVFDGGFGDGYSVRDVFFQIFCDIETTDCSGTTDVTFAALLTGNAFINTDAYGVAASVLAAFSLSVTPADDCGCVFDYYQEFNTYENGSYSGAINVPQFATLSLAYNTEYEMFMDLESGSFALNDEVAAPDVPEPATLSLVGLGLAAAFGARRARRRTTTA